MCGIAGLITPSAISHDVLEHMARTMAHQIHHRGPDDCGVWIDSSFGVALAHRRLSILDLSPAGNQPMVSHCGRYVLSFNGEIYNYQELRSLLHSCNQAPAWHGRSDSEVLLAAISAWGLEETLLQSRGMFAFALWDRVQKCLLLARDRIGEKPLYYGTIGSNFAFASELKALRALSVEPLRIDPGAQAQMLQYGYVPTPYSIYKGIFKLQPGTYIRVNLNGSFSEPVTWWSFSNQIQHQTHKRNLLSDSEAISGLDFILKASISEQMISDVPLGAMLSGGLDSSLVAAIMQEHSSIPIRTFTIGFSESDYNEANHARAVARHLGTDHTELTVSPSTALDLIPKLPLIYDEPFADASQIPTTLLCQLTQQHVSVSLTGDAGDELFSGYNRYLFTNSLWRSIKLVPPPMRRLLSCALTSASATQWNSFFSSISSIVPSNFVTNNPGDKLHKLAQVLNSNTSDDLYRNLISQWRGPLPLYHQHILPTLLSDSNLWPSLPTFTERMMAVDTLTYLPDDILVKVDRAAMSTSLETRVPFLDPRVLSFAWSLPINQKIRNGSSKWVLRQLLYKYVPRELVDRPKQGFGVPLEHWLRGPLRDWAEELLAPSALSVDGLIDPQPIRDIWKLHLSGHNVQYALWNVLMYQAWRLHWL